MLELNPKEQTIYDVLSKSEKLTIEEIAREAWLTKGTGPDTKGNSHVRNSLRKLVNYGIAKQVSRGTYKLTGKKPEDIKDVKPRKKKGEGSAAASEKKAAAPKKSKPKAAKAKKAAAPKATAPKKSAAPKKAKEAPKAKETEGNHAAPAAEASA